MALLPLLHWVEEVVGVIIPLEEGQCVVDIVPVEQGETVGVVLVEAHPLTLPLPEPLGEVQTVGVEEGQGVFKGVPEPH